jgi:hypothetical protein
MDTAEQPSPALDSSLAEHPALGRRITLELRPAAPVTWLGPAFATFCGGIASGAFTLSGESLLRLVIAIILTDPILGAWRAAWVNTDWRAPLSVWKPTPTRSWMLLPYARLDSPAARLSQWISSRTKFWNSALWPQVGQALSALVVSGLIALTVALVLGTTTFFITMLALAFAPLETELGAQGAGKWARALGEIAFAWLIGHAAFATPTWESVLLALFFAFAYRGLLSVVPKGLAAVASSRELGFAIANLSQVAVAIILVARAAIIPAGFVGIGLIAQNLWQMAARHADDYASTYLPRIQWFLLAAMLAAALGVPH